MGLKIRKGNIFLTVGALLVLVATFLASFNLYINIQAGKEARSIAEQIRVEITDAPIDMTQPESDNTGETVIFQGEMHTVSVAGHDYIGTLEIPDLELVLPIMEEWNDERLRVSPCRYSGSCYEDNMVIAGHNYARHFSPIKNLPVGSKINFTDVSGNVYLYEISWSENLKGNQIEEMITKSNDPDKDWDLTLFTCSFDGSKRVAVRCVRVKK